MKTVFYATVFHIWTDKRVALSDKILYIHIFRLYCVCLKMT
jgi:hypothetical protein